MPAHLFEPAEPLSITLDGFASRFGAAMAGGMPTDAEYEELNQRIGPTMTASLPLLGPDGLPIAPLADRTAYQGATFTYLADMEQANQRLRGLLNRVSERGNLVAQENLALRRALAKLRGTIVPRTTEEMAAAEEPTSEQTSVQKRVADVLNDIQTGGMQQPERTKLRGALDKAEAQPTGRVAQDQALGRAIARFHR